MAVIKGIPVTLYQRQKVGSDPFGAPIYEEKPEIVQDVLVSPTTSEDVETSTQLYGKHGSYTLGIPKGDEHQWENSKVEFFGRIWHTIGIAQYGIESNVPTRWHGKIQVEVYESGKD